MVVLTVVFYMVVGVIEICLWPHRSRKEMWVYIFLLIGVATLSVLLILSPELKGPNPSELLKKLWNLIKGAIGQR